MTVLLKTPLHAWHTAQGGKMASFAGWDMPIQYKGIIAEHLHTREKTSLFDICHMGEFILKGQGAGETLSRILTHNLETLKPERCRYGFLLNNNGGILDDLIVCCLDADHYMLVVNAARRAVDYATITSRLPAGLALKDVSDATGKIDLQGPSSLNALERILPGPWRKMPYFGIVRTEFDGSPLLVSRTGYTGELGFELYLPTDKTLALWQACLADPDVDPAGLGARDTLRLEVGLPLYGQDIDVNHTPAEAGYGAMLTSAAAYMGKPHALDVREKLVGLTLEGRRSARQNDAVMLHGKQVGTVTSASFAPSLGYAVALAYVGAEHAEETDFVITAAKTELPAARVGLPFYTKGTARMKLA